MDYVKNDPNLLEQEEGKFWNGFDFVGARIDYCSDRLPVAADIVVNGYGTRCSLHSHQEANVRKRPGIRADLRVAANERADGPSILTGRLTLTFARSAVRGRSAAG